MRGLDTTDSVIHSQYMTTKSDSGARVTFRLPRDLFEVIETMARDQDVTASWLIRKLVKEGIRAQQAQAK